MYYGCQSPSYCIPSYYIQNGWNSFLILVLVLGCDAVSTIANTDSSSSTSGTSSTDGGTPSGDGTTTSDSGTTTGDSGTGGGVVFSSEVSTGQAEFISFAADAQNGYLYVAYLDVTSNSVVVKKTSLSGNWIEIGNFIISSGRECKNVSICLDPTLSSLYLAYLEFSISGGAKILVKQYTNGTWQSFGTEITGASIGTYSSFYVFSYKVDAYTNRTAVIYPGSGGYIYFTYWDGNSWINLGGGYISNQSVDGFSSYVSEVVASNYWPFVAFEGGDAGYIKYWYGEGWRTFGGETQYNTFQWISGQGGTVDDVSISFLNDKLFVSFSDDVMHNKLYVKDKTIASRDDAWHDTPCGVFDIAYDPNDHQQIVSLASSSSYVYIAYRNTNGGITVQKYVTDNTWSEVGTINGNAEFISLIIINDVPYVAYKDISNSGKAMVKKIE